MASLSQSAHQVVVGMEDCVAGVGVDQLWKYWSPLGNINTQDTSHQTFTLQDKGLTSLKAANIHMGISRHPTPDLTVKNVELTNLKTGYCILQTLDCLLPSRRLMSLELSTSIRLETSHIRS